MREFHEHKSQKRLNKNLDKAADQRERLLEDEKVSLASGLGQLVITVSQALNYAVKIDKWDQHKLFITEAERLRDERAAQHKDVIIRTIALPHMLKRDFADPEVTDMVLIGHGTIASLWTDSRGETGYFGWRDAARATKHLKQGKIEQMMCGHFPLNYSVPLGTFAVSKLSNVWASPGNKIPLPDGTPRDHLFEPIYNDFEPVTQQIARLNQIHIEPETTRKPR